MHKKVQRTITKKPMPSTYLLQSMQGQLFGTHYLIDFLNLPGSALIL